MTRYLFRHDGYFLTLSKIITFLFQGQKIGKSDAFMGLGIGESNKSNYWFELLIEPWFWKRLKLVAIYLCLHYWYISRGGGIDGDGQPATCYPTPGAALRRGPGHWSSDDWVPVQRWRPELWRSRNNARSSQVGHHHHDPHKQLTFNWNCRTFEAASSQSFSGGNVVNKKTVYSRKEANVPGQTKSWLEIIFFKNAIASHALLCSFIFSSKAFLVSSGHF